jgi:hypothetical protein
MASHELHTRDPAVWVALRHWMYARGLKSAASLRLPDFLGIGAQKAGTTWLHANLKMHPEIFLPAEAKEVHFFDKHHLDYALEGYSSLFRNAGARGGKVAGEITPAYGIVPPRRIRFVRAVMPNVKLIFLMRNPIERAWSHALMNLVTDTGRKIEEIGDGEFLAHFDSRASRRRGDYEMILGNWLRYFPRRQVFVGLFDDLTGRPRELLGKMFSFLGVRADVDFSGYPIETNVFKGPNIAMPERLRKRLVEVYEQPIRRLGKLFDVPVDRWLA